MNTYKEITRGIIKDEVEEQIAVLSEEINIIKERLNNASFGKVLVCAVGSMFYNEVQIKQDKIVALKDIRKKISNPEQLTSWDYTALRSKHSGGASSSIQPCKSRCAFWGRNSRTERIYNHFAQLCKDEQANNAISMVEIKKIK